MRFSNIQLKTDGVTACMNMCDNLLRHPSIYRRKNGKGHLSR